MASNVDLVRTYMRAVNDDAMDLTRSFAHPEIEYSEASDLPGAAHTSGLDELLSYFYGWRKNWSEWDWREEEIVDLPPDRVLVVATLRLRGLRSGIWVERRWAYTFTMRDGLILPSRLQHTRRGIGGDRTAVAPREQIQQSREPAFGRSLDFKLRVDGVLKAETARSSG
jgi:ketosteroid isomerase-like protein